jgi:4-hydroxybenzoyl-CoA thioesterase
VSGGCFERSQRIRFAHCDPAGIVFFPQYLVLLNGHVEDWVSDGLGLPYAGLIGERRIGLPTVRLECDFRAISRMGDDVIFALRLERLGTRSLTLRTEVRGADGALRAALRQVLVSTRLDTHAAIALPADLRTAAEVFGTTPQS